MGYIEPVYYLPFLFFILSLLISLCFFEIRRQKLNKMLDEGMQYNTFQYLFEYLLHIVIATF